MIYDIKNQNQGSESTSTAKSMRLSENAAATVFQIFTKNVYSNPIGTIVREITSNAFDSHVEANVDLPVRIKLSHDNITKTDYISFIDYGVGMSPDRVDNIYSVYFESTKRETNDQIGGFGIGGKTPLAYKRYSGSSDYDNSFYVITTYNGIKYTYTIYEGSDSPIITLLYSEETSDCNGTEVKIPVLKNDINTFTREIKRQLYYFENLVLEGFDQYIYAPNEYKIVKAKTFLYRGDEYSNRIHICLGRVAYPIDYNALGLYPNDFDIPVALRLNVGDVNVTISRESIDYSAETIEFLKKKLNQCITEIKDLITKQYDNVITLEDYYKAINDFGTLYLTPKLKFNIKRMISPNECTFNNFKYKDIHRSKFNELDLNACLHITLLKGRGQGQIYSKFDYYNLTHHNILYLNENEEMIKNPDKLKYLKERKKTYLIRFCGKPTIKDKLIVQLYDEYYDLIKKYGTNYNNFIVPADYIAELELLKEEKRALKKSQKLRFNSYIYNNTQGSDRPITVTFQELINFNGTIFYGTKEDKHLYYNAVKFFNTYFNYEYKGNPLYKHNGKHKILFIQTPKSQVRNFKYCKKAYHIKDFYIKMGYRKENYLISNYEQLEVLNNVNNINSIYLNKGFKFINEKIANKIDEIKQFCTNKADDIITIDFYIKYFKINMSDSHSNKYNHILNIIDEVNKYTKKYEKYTNFINPPYDYGNNSDFISFIKKIYK